MRKHPASKLDKSLVENAAAVARRSAERRREEAQSLVDLIRRRMGAIAEAFFDIGEALNKLRHEKMFGALGFATFRALVEGELGLSIAQAYKLMEIAARVPRPEAVALGPSRSAALLQLARSTPEPDSIVTLLRDGVTLPGRKGRVDLRQLSTRELLRAARVERRAHVSPKRRASEAEMIEARTWARKIQRTLRLRGARDTTLDTLRRKTAGGTEVIRIRLEFDAASAPLIHTALHAPRDRKP